MRLGWSDFTTTCHVGDYLCVSVGWRYPGTLREICQLALVCSCPNLVFALPPKTRTGMLGDHDRQQVPLIPPPAFLMQLA